MHSKKSTNCESKCRHFFNWFTQLGVISTLIFLIIALSTNNDDLFGGALGSFIFFYIIYIIMCFCSPSFRYLINKHKADSIHKHMQNLYYTAPSLTFHVVCYHYEVHHYTERDSKGNIHHRTRTERVVTHSESENFRFCSWRDISGCFLLDSEKFLRNENREKVYIKLELDLDFQFADDITRYDYEMQKQNFKMRNIYRDVHMDFSENVDLTGFTQYNLVKINNQSPACMNCGLYLIFTFIIPVIEFYKIYVNSFCISQDYTIKKVVSTRYNLYDNNFNNNNNVYQNEIPKIIIYGQETNYNEAPTDYTKVYDLPTEEELTESKKYTSSKIGSKFNKNNVVTFNKDDVQNNNSNNNFHNFSTNLNVDNGQNLNSESMMQGGSMPMMNNSANAPMMQGGSMPMMNNSANAPMIQGGSIPMMNNSTNATMMQGGLNPIVIENADNHDLERKLLD